MTVNRLPDYLEHMRKAINLEVVWDTVQTALPALKTQLNALPPA